MTRSAPAVGEANGNRLRQARCRARHDRYFPFQAETLEQAVIASTRDLTRERPPRRPPDNGTRIHMTLLKVKRAAPLASLF